MKASPTKLTEAQRANLLNPLLDPSTVHPWSLLAPSSSNTTTCLPVKQEAVGKAFQFDSFVAAWGFMSEIALVAERNNHHPEWFNVYNQVHIHWSTHDCAGLSERDIESARYCDEVFARVSGPKSK